MYLHVLKPKGGVSSGQDPRFKALEDKLAEVNAKLVSQEQKEVMERQKLAKRYEDMMAGQRKMLAAATKSNQDITAQVKALMDVVKPPDKEKGDDVGGDEKEQTTSTE